MKYLFMFSGIATNTDKVRGIDVGDEDVQAVVSTDDVDPRGRCTLTEIVFQSKTLLNKDW